MKVKIKVGIVGCGVIGSEIAKACAGRFKDKIAAVRLFDSDTTKLSSLARSLKGRVSIASSLDELVKRSDLIIEAASAKVSPVTLNSCLKHKRDLMVMSVGGLLGSPELIRKVLKSSIRLYIPSGAICGIDGVKAQAVGKIESVTLTTRKPPMSLSGAPYVVRKNMNLSRITKETVIFNGTALEAVGGFPQNINVAAVLSLAGIGAAKTRVQIIASPEYTRNVHEVEVVGEAGRVFTRTENVPSRINPKTSALAFYSAIATLEGILSNIKIGA